jgi:hypothetical protein
MPYTPHRTTLLLHKLEDKSMSGINGVQPGSKPIEVQKSEEPATPAKTESAPKEEIKDTFENRNANNTFDNFASGPTNASKLPPGEAMTAKGLAYLKMKEAEKLATGEARTAKGAAYLKWKEAHGEPGEARTAKGQAYQKMMQQEEAKASQQLQPGEAPRTKKQSGIQQ